MNSLPFLRLTHWTKGRLDKSLIRQKSPVTSGPLVNYPLGNCYYTKFLIFAEHFVSEINIDRRFAKYEIFMYWIFSKFFHVLCIVGSGGQYFVFWNSNFGHEIQNPLSSSKFSTKSYFIEARLSSQIYGFFFCFISRKL